MRVRRLGCGRESGWTAVEALIVLTLIGLLVGRVAIVTEAAVEAVSDEATSMQLDDGANRVLDQIALAVMGSDRGTLIPTIEDIHTSGIRYKFSMGLEDGEVVWSAPEEIDLDAGTSVVWKDNPDSLEERRVTWTNLVRPLLEGEIPNGVDDNGNGLVDETGLSFVLDGESVLIRLSLQRVDEEGQITTSTAEARVTCRN